MSRIWSFQTDPLLRTSLYANAIVYHRFWFHEIWSSNANYSNYRILSVLWTALIDPEFQLYVQQTWILYTVNIRIINQRSMPAFLYSHIFYVHNQNTRYNQICWLTYFSLYDEEVRLTFYLSYKQEPFGDFLKSSYQFAIYDAFL